MKALVLVDHGSRQPEAGQATEQVAALVRQRIGSGWLVRVAHLEVEPPDLPTMLDRCVGDGATEIVVHPYFLAPGRHAAKDVTAQVEQARSQHPAIGFRVTPPLGPHELLAELVLHRIRHE